MNENELRARLDEAAAHMTLTPHAPRRVLRRARLRMGLAAAAATAACALLALGATAALDAAGRPDARPAGPPDGRVPRDVPVVETVGLLTGGRFDDGTQWWLIARRRDGERCLGVQVESSTFSDCVPLRVPGRGPLGFYEWDRADPGPERYEVVGKVAPEAAEVDVVVDGRALPARLVRSGDVGVFVAFLPRDAVGTVVARDADGEVLAVRELCLPPDSLGISCHATATGTGSWPRGVPTPKPPRRSPGERG